MSRIPVYNSNGIRIEWNSQNTYSVFDNDVETDSFYVYPTKSHREAIRNARIWIAQNRWN